MIARPLQLEGYSTLGQFIRSYRRMLDLSQQDIADATGLGTGGKNTVSLIENEKIVPNFFTAVKILNFLRSKGAPAIDLQAVMMQDRKKDLQSYERENDEPVVEREAVTADWEPSRE